MRSLLAARRFTRSVAQGLLLDRQLAYWRGGPAADRRARVLAVIPETADTRTFVLRPPAGWAGHRAGQHTTVEVEVDGVRVRRCYSIASAPSEATLAITVKRLPGGRVSGWLHDRVGPGATVWLGPAAGELVDDDGAAPLLLISGGSGITPVMSILRARVARGAVGDVVFVHHARTRADVIFARELEGIAARDRGLRLLVHTDDDPRDGGFDEDRLAARVPDFADRTALLCGPAGLMDRIEAMWARAGASARLRRERFTAPPLPTSAAGAPVAVRLARSGRTVVADGAGTLLEQLERAGARPPSGCRMGICQTCTCTKVRGVVENLRTGVISRDPDEPVQLCVSVARSPLDLAL